jgi:hypothetical protein
MVTSAAATALGALLFYDGEKFRAVAVRGLPEALADRLRQGFAPGPNHPSQALLEGERFVQVPDWAEIDDPIARASLDAGVRTTLFIPLRREGKLLGYISATRSEVRPFSEKEIALLESFAAQAVIAMENAPVILPEGAICSIARRFEIAVKSLPRLVPPAGSLALPQPTTRRQRQARRRQAAHPQSRRRRAGHRMQCIAARHYPSNRACSCNAGCYVGRRYSAASVCVRNGDNGLGPQARRRHAWARHDVGLSEGCWTPSCGLLRTSPS